MRGGVRERELWIERKIRVRELQVHRVQFVKSLKVQLDLESENNPAHLRQINEWVQTREVGKN